MKKILILLFVLAIAVAAFYFLFFRGRNTGNGPEGAGAPAITPTGRLNVFPVSLQNIPQTPTVILGTKNGSVEVRNFYKDATGQEGDTLLLKDAASHRIVYNARDSNFWIFIIGKPVDAARKEAEADFLKILNINQHNACLLDASWSASVDAAPDLAGRTYPLSFCPPR
jgi:hypothetical protein